ncbi:valine--tRNA ligase [Ochrobactrum sp. MYb379]|uniref:valine--tRNA ligase n=1 Tax=Ochrobactrum sp. MYb379 TaxID=2745275 RepID=UPI0030B01480
MLEKTYDAAAVEPKIAERWEEAGAFKAGAGAKPGADPFAVVIPPPNVTGSLHMGHALNNTIQDIMVRFERMRGKNVLWQPGMDHAGIATQMVVERQLAERKEPNRHAMGREKFIERIWQWKSESGGLISNQLRRLGASCDWSRERFTMDEGLSRAVLEVFVSLHKQGLIYRDKRLVNWDPKLLTAISDIEVESREIKGHLWHLRYPLENVPFDPENPHTFIVVATTRPETMLGDTGVAVNPKDERYHASIGNNIVLPLVGRRIPIVADDYADPEAGSGAVKITPAHDFNDFEVGKRNDLRVINILTPEAAITLKDNVDFLEGLELTHELTALIKEFEGLDRFAARKRLVETLEEQGYLEKIEDHTHAVPHGDRGGVPIEPYLTDQWYVNAAELAKPAMAAVRDGRTQIVPKNWEKTYFEWMENIQPWCVSRQLWWGHQIPAWYGPDGEWFVEKSEEEAKAAALAHYGKEVALERDSDVLDTWFSSGLWPFSTLGWPDKTPELAAYYPTSVLVTGFDILFFWVARMMMMGMHVMEEIPFHTVYLHALVRDKHGAKMSKSKGNVIDPLELMDEYGADALRFTLAIMAAQGRDVKLDPARIAGYRNFGTKLWNATRFAQMNGVRLDPNFKPDDAKLAVNRWILTELTKATSAVTDGIANYRFNEAASAAYRFVWNQFCDWYLELLKPIFMGEDELAKTEAQATAAYCLDEIYKMLHPFMPFMTEELWTLTAGEGTKRDTVLALAEWPQLSFADEESATDINWLVDLVMGIRSVRAEMNVPAGAVAPIVVLEANAATLDRFARHDAAIKRLARVETISFAEEAPKGSAQLVHGEATICLPLGSLIDLKAEAARMAKEAGKIAAEMEKIEKKLSNEKFVANAKEEVVKADRERLAELKEAAARVATAEARIREAG